MEQYLDTDVSNKIIVWDSLSVQIDKEFNSGSGQPNYAIEHHWMHISKENIEHYIRPIQPHLCKKNMKNFDKRMKIYHAEDHGGPSKKIKDILTKKTTFLWKSLETPTEKSSLEALDNFPHYP